MSENHLPRIDCLYAFVAKDDNGNEGLAAYRTPDGWMPLIIADPALVDSLRGAAKSISLQSGQTLTLCRFGRREELEVVQAVDVAIDRCNPTK